MSAFSFSSSEGEPIAIADIQNGKVAIAIALLYKDKPLQILAVAHSELSFEDRTHEAAIAALADQIDQVGKEILQKYASKQRTYGPVAKTYAIINTPWTRSQMIRAASTFDTEKRITDDDIDTLAKQALHEMSEINTKELLEAGIVHIELNGYATSKPVGKHAHTILVYGLISDCDPRVRSIVTDGLKKIFSSSIVFRSQLRTILSATAALPQIPLNYCLIDITRETTTISNVHAGLSLAHTIIPEGTLSILKRIGGSTLPEETLALLRMIFTDECTSSTCNALRATMTRVEPDIIHIFGEAMIELVAERYLPPSVVLVCENACVPWLSQLFSRIDFTQFTTTTQPFEVIVLDAVMLQSFVQTPLETIDMRLALAAALVHMEERMDA